MLGYGASLCILLPLLCRLATADRSPVSKRCYSCTSYMSQCKGTVDDQHDDVFKAMCKGQCFVRMGEDGEVLDAAESVADTFEVIRRGYHRLTVTFNTKSITLASTALYRGCFDGFVEVEQLTHGYDRCRNQTWNGKTLPWCMCDEDLCNGDSMNMGDFYNIDAYSYDGNTDDHSNTVFVESSNYEGGNDGYVYNNADDSYSANQDTTYRYDGSSNQDTSYGYDDTFSANQDANYGYDSMESTNNVDQSDMNKFAREGPTNPTYDETLFGVNDFSRASHQGRSQYGTPDYRTPYPGDYRRNYYGQDSPGVAYDSTNAGGQKLYYPRPHLQQEEYYPHNRKYNRESGPEYNYNQQRAYQEPQPQPPITYQEPQPQEDRGSNYVTSRLAAKIRCSKSGYYQNPNDCRQFIACLMDPYSKTPVMHLMKCPEGLVWDNIKKICMQYSTTCNVAVADNMAVNDFTRSDAANKVDVTGFNSNTVKDGYYGNNVADAENNVHVISDDKEKSSSRDGNTYQNVQDTVF